MSSYHCPTCGGECHDLGYVPGKGHVYADTQCTGACKSPLAPHVTEAQLQRAIIDMATALGWTCWHDNDSRRNVAGLPDLICVHPTHGLVFIELKTVKGRLRQAQREWLDLLTQAGQRAYVIRPTDMDFAEALFRGVEAEAA